MQQNVITEKTLSSSFMAAIGILGLRLLLAYEFLEAGLQKFQGENWFTQIQDAFPFPFSVLPAELNWNLAMGAELLFPILLVLGLFTRFSAISLAVVTIVAWIAVHQGNGYNVCNNGYKMALMYLVILLPLITQGAGRLSVDFLLQKNYLAKKTWLKYL